MKPLANFALVGYVLFALGAGGLGLLAGAPFFGVGPAWLHVPAGLLAAVAAGLALRKPDPRTLAGAGALGVLLLASAASGLPSATTWTLALLSGLGLLVYAENAALVWRLERAGRAEGALTPEASDRLGQEMRRAQTLPLLATAGLLGAGVFLARGLFLLVDPGLAASLEAGGAAGLAVVAAALAALLWVYKAARGKDA